MLDFSQDQLPGFAAALRFKGYFCSRLHLQLTTGQRQPHPHTTFVFIDKSTDLPMITIRMHATHWNIQSPSSLKDKPINVILRLLPPMKRPKPSPPPF